MRALSAFLVLALVTAACAPLFAQQKVTDDWIYDEVRRRLANDTVVKGGGLGVEVAGGVVTLSGKVKTKKQKTRAETITKRVRGVSKVVNKLVVDL
ncbi:MAG: BON domain-containing protein [Bryobacterales bacterium]|nr:BON domain-containing protein [Bryobacterales bacterium]